MKWLKSIDSLLNNFSDFSPQISNTHMNLKKLEYWWEASIVLYLPLKNCYLVLEDKISINKDLRCMKEKVKYLYHGFNESWFRSTSKKSVWEET